MLALELLEARQQQAYELAEAAHYAQLLRDAEAHAWLEPEDEPEKPNRTEVIAGLVRGELPAPVGRYIWDSMPDLDDLIAIEKHAKSWVEKNCGVCESNGSGPNCVWDEDVEVYHGSPMTVYVTGPTACVAAVIAACARCGVPLTLMHYDAETNDYTSQDIFLEEDF